MEGSRNNESPTKVPTKNLDKKVSRRAFLGGATGIALAASHAAARLNNDKSPLDVILDGFAKIGNSNTKDHSLAQVNEGQPADIRGNETLTMTPEEEILYEANKILDASTPQERNIFEKSFVDRVIREPNKQFSLKGIDLALGVVSDPDQICRLQDVRYLLRQEGIGGLKKLTNKELEFCNENNFFPEGLAICKEKCDEAFSFLSQQFPPGGGKKFYALFKQELVRMAKDGQFPKKELLSMQQDVNSIKRGLINPGGILGLALQETGYTSPVNDKIYVFANRGNKPATEGLKAWYPEKQFPKEAERLTKDLDALCQFLSVKTGLHYNLKNILGSFSGDIGPLQFRPDTALNMVQFLDMVQPGENSPKKTFNIFGLDAVPLAFIHLFRGSSWYNAQGELQEQIGYLKNTYDENGKEIDYEAFRSDALTRWNPSLQAIILKWANIYYEEIINPNPTPTPIPEHLAKTS